MACMARYLCIYNNTLYNVSIYDNGGTVIVSFRPLYGDMEMEYYNDGRDEHVVVRFAEFSIFIRGFQQISRALGEIEEFLARMLVVGELSCKGDCCKG